MDYEETLNIKTFEGQGLSYFNVLRSLPCVDIISTPLNGDSCLDIRIADFGPMVMLHHLNDGPAVVDAVAEANTLSIQLPLARKKMVAQFQNLPGGGGHSPFQMAGARCQWVIPQGMPMLHLHVDKRLMLQVIGSQAMEDYQELCNAHSRKAYDPVTLMQAAGALERAITLAFVYKKYDRELDQAKVASLLADIVVPLISSDLIEVKSSTRQKILSRSLDYILQNFKLPIRLADLAEASSTSVRNLQIVFKQELNVSPNKYVQQFRLHRFREHLMVSRSVTEAAYNCGFKHLGRLTEQYTRVFNRKPSEDLLVKQDLKLNLGRFFD